MAQMPDPSGFMVNRAVKVSSDEQLPELLESVEV
jgi:hypothetical protein